MYKIYQVEYGDTISSIANKVGTTIDNIRMINGIKNDNELVTGGLIIVPKDNNLLFSAYNVEPGESIYSISRKYNVEPNILLEINGLNKNDYIYPNQEILVPKKDVILYVTKPGDTLDQIAYNLNIDYSQLIRQNNKIYVVEDQLIAIKKELN